MNMINDEPQITYWDAQASLTAYSIKRHGVSLLNCDAEPVQTPGCVQAHGALLVLRLADLHILQASDNAQAVLGHGVESLLDQPIAVVVGADGEKRVRAMLDTEPTERNPIHVFTLPAAPPHALPMDVTVHTIDGVAVLEFEVSSAAQRQAGLGSGAPPIQSAAPDYYALIKKSVGKLQLAEGLRPFCQVLADEIRLVTGMDRVMIYRFHADHHGEVFAESRIDSLEPWLGLHYPAEDIPKPARDIFSKTWIRPVPDITAELAEMVPLRNPDTGKPLDMTYCALRGVSVMYTEYLSNMGVTAGLTMPLRRGDFLWGLVACHHYGGPRSLPYELRAACEFLAQVASLQHQSVEDREHADYSRRLDEVNSQLVMVAARHNELGSIVENTEGAPGLLAAMQAGGAAVFDQNRWWHTGRTPGDKELNALSDWLRRRGSDAPDAALYVTDALSSEYPPGADFADVASGVLAASISHNGHKRVMWFRPELIQTINWGGNPHEKLMVAGPFGPRLTPRGSFELFSETVYQRALPWLKVEVDAASQLRMQLRELVINRAEMLAKLNSDLTIKNEELDSFAYVAGHDLKEPLRGIHKYAHQLLERAESFSADDSRRLESMMRLTIRMDSLLDSLLHFARVGREELLMEQVDLNAVVADAIEIVGSRSSDGCTDIKVVGELPVVICDHIGVREIFVNLLSNALKYNDKATPCIEVGAIAPGEIERRKGFPADLSTETVFYVADNGIGILPQHFAQVFKIFRRLHAREEFGGGSGVGLTIVRKLIERHRGRVWIESQPGQGTRVFFTLGKSGNE
jgi:two-component system, chemotaxis family, sensor kinase Cph1